MSVLWYIKFSHSKYLLNINCVTDIVLGTKEIVLENKNINLVPKNVQPGGNNN